MESTSMRCCFVPPYMWAFSKHSNPPSTIPPVSHRRSPPCQPSPSRSRVVPCCHVPKRTWSSDKRLESKRLRDWTVLACIEEHTFRRTHARDARDARVRPAHASPGWTTNGHYRHETGTMTPVSLTVTVVDQKRSSDHNPYGSTCPCIVPWAGQNESGNIQSEYDCQCLAFFTASHSIINKPFISAYEPVYSTS